MVTASRETVVFVVWSAGILPCGLLVHTHARSPEAGFSILDMEALLVQVSVKQNELHRATVSGPSNTCWKGSLFLSSDLLVGTSEEVI